MSDRKPHAALDITSRTLKASKIARLLESSTSFNGKRVLDIGAGSGFIAAHFADLGSQVTAVDVLDQRQLKHGYGFVKIQSVILPFGNESFDIIISNHVIEHVGDLNAQETHLREIDRALAHNGVVYIGAPNKWAVVEPHFKLPLLSWFPNAVSSFLVRLADKGEFYDCVPPSRRTLVKMLNNTSIKFQDSSLAAMRVMAEVEHATGARKAILNAPNILIRMLRLLIPTMIFIGEKPGRR